MLELQSSHNKWLSNPWSINSIHNILLSLYTDHSWPGSMCPHKFSQWPPGVLRVWHTLWMDNLSCLISNAINGLNTYWILLINSFTTFDMTFSTLTRVSVLWLGLFCHSNNCFAILTRVLLYWPGFTILTRILLYWLWFCYVD